MKYETLNLMVLAVLFIMTMFMMTPQTAVATLGFSNPLASAFGAMMPTVYATEGAAEPDAEDEADEDDGEDEGEEVEDVQTLAQKNAELAEENDAPSVPATAANLAKHQAELREAPQKDEQSKDKLSNASSEAA